MLSIKQKTAFVFFEGGRSILKRDDMKRIGKEAKDLIMERIGTQGTDRRGARMSPYSKGYAKRKKAGALPDKGNTNTGHRDLWVSGQFWQSFKIVSASKKKVIIGWTDARSVMIAEAEAGRNDFLGLSPRNEKDLGDLIEDVVGRRVEKLQFIRKR